MHPTFPSESERLSVHAIVEDLLGERIEALAGWIQELDASVRTLSAAGDEHKLKELRKALEAWSKRDPKFEEKLTERVDVLADRIATLSSAVNTTAAAHAGSDGEIASLRRELEQATEWFDGALRNLQPAPASIDAEKLRRLLEQASEAHEGPGKREVQDLRAKIAKLTERIDTLAKTVATTAAGMAGREGEIACLRRSLEDETTRVERTLDELRDAVSSSQAGAVETQLRSLERKLAALGTKAEETAALRGRLDHEAARSEAEASELRGALAFLSSQVSALQASAEDASDLAALESRVGTVEGRISELVAALDSLTARVPDLGPVSAELDSLAVGLHELRAAAHEGGAAQSSRTDMLEQALLDAVERISAVERGSEEREQELARRNVDWNQEHAWVRERLDALVREASAPQVTAEVEAQLGRLAERLELLEEAGAAMSEEIARARDGSAVDREALDARLAELAATAAEAAARGEGAVSTAHLDGVVDRLETRIEDIAARSAAIPPSQDEQLRELLVAFADRIEAMERNLSARMDALEPAPTVPPLTVQSEGDGRFLLELRALELRLQQAEAQARTGREEFLLQLERIASRLDWRLQRLEGELETPAYHEAPTEPVLGQVVPIRGGTET